MDYDGTYEDLQSLAQEASRRAVMWLERDEAHALRLLRFAGECERFRNEIFLNGYGGY
jgi:hypothetical protein